MRHIAIIAPIIFICLTLISCTSASTSSSDNSTTSNNSTTSTTETSTDNTTTSSGMFVVVGFRLYRPNSSCILNACLKYVNRLLTSSDNGTTWENSLIINFYNRGGSIDLINNVLMLTSAEETIIYSEDGTSWYYESNFPGGSSKLAYGNGTYLSFNPAWYNFKISFDRTTWNSIALGSIDDGVFGNDIFVIGGNGGIYKSTDYGENWTKEDSGTWIGDIVFGNNTFVATTGNGVVISEDNGSTWTYNLSFSGSIIGVSYGSSKFVAVGDDGKIYSLSDGDSSWIERTSGTTHDLNDVSYGNGTFVVIGDNEEVGSYPRSPSSVILISDDGGLTWETKFTSGTEWQTSDGKTNRFTGVVFKE